MNRVAVQGIILLLPLCCAVAAQTTPGSTTFQNQFPDPIQYTPPVIPPPEMVLHVLREIPLDGPIGADLRLEEGAVVVSTSNGLGSHRQPVATAEEDAPGKRRYRARIEAGQKLILERSCRSCPRLWRRAWKLKTPGIADAAPIVSSQRLSGVFGSGFRPPPERT